MKIATNLLKYGKGIAFLLSCFHLPFVQAGVEDGFTAKLTGIYTHNDSASWRHGDLGRFSSGADNDNNHDLLGELQAGYQTTFLDNFQFTAHIQAIDSSDDFVGDHFGIVELNIKYAMLLSDIERLRFTLGQFFNPSSLENVDPFWDSPYTITYSSMNSWVGEEYRPTGLDMEYTRKLSNRKQLKVALLALTGNDSMGALIAWRGWSYGRLRVGYDETVALPDLDGFTDGEAFAEQQSEGSKPFGRDLDNRLGYAFRVSLGKPGSYLFKFGIVDNNGDKELHRGEYAWKTKFITLGALWQVTNDFTLIVETMEGETSMGPMFPPPAYVDFYSSYLLASYKPNQWRFSARYDDFRVEEEDAVPQDINEDRGNSITAAVFYEAEDGLWKTGIEYIAVKSSRERQLVSGLVEQNDEEQFSWIVHFKY